MLLQLQVEAWKLIVANYWFKKNAIQESGNKI